MAKLKVITVVGTRPEIIRLSRVIHEFDKRFDHTLVFTGQNSDPSLSKIFFEHLEVREPDVFLGVDNSSPATAIGQTLVGVESIIRDKKPNALLVLGDTNSAYALIIAKRMGVITYHMEAGNRSFDENVPEEINRRIIDHAADVNLPYNQYSLRNLLQEGLHPRKIFVSGSPLPEVLKHYESKIEESEALESLGLEAGGFLLASIHRQENVDSPIRLGKILSLLNQTGSNYSLPVVFSTHPRTKSKIDSHSYKQDDFPWIRWMPPFGFFDYLKLQKYAYCVISDSGTVSEEASILRFPAVSLRDSIERQEGLDSASLVLSSVGIETLGESIEMARSYFGVAPCPDGYDRYHVSKMVANTIQSTVFHVPVWNNSLANSR